MMDRPPSTAYSSVSGPSRGPAMTSSCAAKPSGNV